MGTSEMVQDQAAATAERSEADRDPRRFTGFAFLAFGFLAAVTGGQALPLLQTLAALAGTRWRRLLRLLRENAIWLLPTFAALAWLATSASWSLTPDAPVRAAKHAGVVIVALLFSAAATATADARTLTRFGCWAGALSLVVLACAEAFADLPLNRVLQPAATDMVRLSSNPGRGVSVLVLLCFPALAAGRGLPPIGSLGILGGAALLSVQFGMAANAAALAAGAAAFAAALLLPRVALWLCGLVWAGWLLGFAWMISPLLDRLPTDLPLSWRMRGGIWEFAAARVAERPWQGWGFEASRSFTGVQEHEGVVIPNIPLHTHSGSLQVWLELGGVGAILIAAALLLGARCAARNLGADRLAAAGAAGAAGAAFVFFNVSYGAWQEWLWAAFATAGACAAAARQEPTDPLSAGR